jgi:nucleotide-binding universal stress UspA family protein
MVAPDLAVLAPDDLADQIRRELEPKMAFNAAEAERLAGAKVRALLLPGKPAEEIVHLATTGGHDLVVVGTHGRRGVRRIVLGSVAEHVVRSAPASVLVARGKEWLDFTGED